MAQIEKLILTDDEMAELRDIQDKYNMSVKVMQETLGGTLMKYWAKIRAKYNLHDCPFHVVGSMIWYLKDATQEEHNAFITMTTKRNQ